MNFQTWGDGTPKSSANAFDLAPLKITPTIAQAKAEAHRLDCLQRYHRKVAMQKAERVNRQDFSISPTPQADRDKSNVIAGRKNFSRSQ